MRIYLAVNLTIGRYEFMVTNIKKQTYKSLISLIFSISDFLLGKTSFSIRQMRFLFLDDAVISIIEKVLTTKN